jgi:hypothetical protein
MFWVFFPWSLSWLELLLNCLSLKDFVCFVFYLKRAMVSRAWWRYMNMTFSQILDQSRHDSGLDTKPIISQTNIRK